ncbi:filamentous hemagglutinin family outer membrane protein [[Leptolyngbya] sp. PCC 7376]|uniref:two-partner secretion domain-containing protein n=1 Tax=[Leptolyngbya] sp. PCC 7376 TaxID=111781 RepID=UPI00029F17D2|nr:filamentous hemagglutinin N-terminal domain-containing protein [[Leptolyngbya] sp. PCC 7376]AFY39959.1 filamentous hemagglutinin family outer membrane protein [[Leptolyngbya] sp. PCC 7376]
MKSSTIFATGAISVSCSLSLLPLSISAQLIPDATLGLESSVVNRIDATRQEIGGGALRQTNLFHSFQEFNVPALEEVYFVPEASVLNIFTRVTGNNSSDILGKLGVYGSPNLFLVNPNGIYFGADASLDILGSFTASTTSNILTEDGFVSISTATKNELLTVNPNALFNNAFRDYQGDIVNAANLAVGTNQSLTLQGNQVSHSGSLTSAEGTVTVLGSDVVLDDAIINVSGINGGDIYVLGADTVQVSSASILDASGTIDGGFIETSAPIINVTGLIDTRGEIGITGTWLLDPVDILIDTALAGTITSNLASSNVEVSTQGAGNVTGTAVSFPVSNGDITLNSNVSNPNSKNSLTLTGRRFIHDSGSFELGGDLVFNLNAVNSEINPPSNSINNAINSIGNIAGKSTINLHAPVGETTTFAGKTINIDKDVTLQAATPANLTYGTFFVGVDEVPIEVVTGVETSIILSGKGDQRVIDIINNRSTININDVTITRGETGAEGNPVVTSGGGIRIIPENIEDLTTPKSIVNINNSNISGNSANYGGGIANAGGEVNLNNSVISNNSASGDSLRGGIGGGIMNWVSGGGGIGVLNFRGKVNITHSTISNNAASDVGGGIANLAELDLRHSVVSDNEAGPEGLRPGGGGITNNSLGDAVISQSLISGNKAFGSGGGIFNFYGEAISPPLRSSVFLSNSTISNNLASENGGGIANYLYGIQQISA